MELEGKEGLTQVLVSGTTAENPLDLTVSHQVEVLFGGVVGTSCLGHGLDKFVVVGWDSDMTLLEVSQLDLLDLDRLFLFI